MRKDRRDCVSAILFKDLQFLVEKRNVDDADPGYAIPGGHVEEGENLEKALKREMREELGIEIGSAILFFTGNNTASDGEKQRVHYFLIEDWRGKLVSKEAESIEWTSDTGVLALSLDKEAVSKARQDYLKR